MDRYEHFAPFYNALSGEWPVYSAGREAGIRALGLRAGMTVLDLGCGTGLNFPGLLSGIGATGRVIGVDGSPAMLAQARRARGTGVDLVCADLTSPLPGLPRVDAVITTYVLSLIPAWRMVWESVVRPLGRRTRVCIVDMQRPKGAYGLLSPLARAACALGGSDIDAHPWTVVEEECDDVVSASARGGHLQIRAGTLR
ncbi:demethylmenaquinone methyltransferase/2-methoxy-6-polyprenyl-1,4-benzoquinol methylase [Arthrobacter pigmenti]|uniref:Demethylmenaquinone methyltransferase/2-methoxy-6-polyprenyl-1,4-benzoquinol methylase n=1 Tax=Arthrobacter pigmenti TaxID=271432 RepID=A0A846RZC3_9MICC|nr:class I SAM-dependent methyltransferase [Arthrobacter pigmenti]NJC24316.1 demethylmenaquinone methyltransferase/2-methoxy-6-polyprenyl-1,4-benzoquinol methylase [Arthrobacter pigmenti]